jgi:hypothetical protein
VSYGGWRHHFQENTEANSEKLRHRICIPIGNNQFFVSPWLAMRTANAVFDIASIWGLCLTNVTACVGIDLIYGIVYQGSKLGVLGSIQSMGKT